MMHLLPVLFIRSRVAILSWMGSCEYVPFEFKRRAVTLMSIGIPCSGLLPLALNRRSAVNEVFLPSYAASSPLIV